MNLTDKSALKLPRQFSAETFETEPNWSVMVPAYNPRLDYMTQALRSVLDQDPGPERMQIEVVDDCSTKVDVASMVKGVAGERVTYSRNQKNLGLAGCWNACIARARGVWVHILHQDDFVLPGFYKRLEDAAQSHPEAGLLASRSFYVDDQGIIQGVTFRLRNLEKGGHAVNDFYSFNPINAPEWLCAEIFMPGLVDFEKDLKYALDWEDVGAHP